MAATANESSMKTNEAQLFIVSAPSGAGKTSLVQRTINDLHHVGVSVSHTTRDKRPGEIEADHYFFTDRNTFEQMIEEDQFLEYAEVFGHYYGTSLGAVQQNLNDGIDVILEIDWQGAAQVRQKLDDVVSIFILPPSRAALIERLTGRGQDSEEVIMRRTEEAVVEMQQYHHADYLIINDDFDQALVELKAVIMAYRVTKSRQALQHAGLITSLTR